MGYYSEVALCLPKQIHAEMLEILAKEKHDVQMEVKELLGSAEKAENDIAILYYWAWVKWYSSFVCVGFITKFLHYLDEKGDESMNYRLLRVGESLDDNAYDGNFSETSFNLEIVRSISYS